LRRNRRTFNRHGRQQKTPAGICAGGGFDERTRPLGRVDNDDRYEYDDELLHRIHGYGFAWVLRISGEIRPWSDFDRSRF